MKPGQPLYPPGIAMAPRDGVTPAPPGVLADGWRGVQTVVLGMRGIGWRGDVELPLVAGGAVVQVSGLSGAGVWVRRWQLDPLQAHRIVVSGLEGIRVELLRSTVASADVWCTASADVLSTDPDVGVLGTSVPAGTYPVPPGATHVYSDVAVPTFTWRTDPATGAVIIQGETLGTGLDVPVRGAFWRHAGAGALDLLWRIRLS